MVNLTHLSLCTGIGGIDLAAKWAGFTNMGMSEIEPYACRVLKKNFKGVKNYGDIRTITAEKYPELCGATVIGAGFPCQPYSLAGKGKGDGDERDLWGEVARVVAELRPRWFVGENVPGLLTRGNGRYFRRILSSLAKMGYTVAWGVWGACDVGAPQKARKRLFVVAYSNSLRQLQSQRCKQDKRRWTCDSSETLVHAAGIRHRASQKKVRSRWHSSQLSSQWQTEPDVGRVADGVPARMDRLRCLGNAVVPQQIYPLLKAIADIERRTS